MTNQAEEILAAPPQPLFKDAGVSTPGVLLLLGRMEGKIDLVLVRTEGVERSVREVDMRLRDVEKCVVPRAEIDERFDDALTRMSKVENFVASLKGVYLPIAGFLGLLGSIFSGYVVNHLK